jgi:hypothetical protein
MVKGGDPHFNIVLGVAAMVAAAWMLRKGLRPDGCFTLRWPFYAVDRSRPFLFWFAGLAYFVLAAIGAWLVATGVLKQV